MASCATWHAAHFVWECLWLVALWRPTCRSRLVARPACQGRRPLPSCELNACVCTRGPSRASLAVWPKPNRGVSASGLPVMASAHGFQWAVACLCVVYGVCRCACEKHTCNGTTVCWNTVSAPCADRGRPAQGARRLEPLVGLGFVAAGQGHLAHLPRLQQQERAYMRLIHHILVWVA